MLVLVASTNLRGSLPGTVVARGTGLADFHEISEIGGEDLLPKGGPMSQQKVVYHGQIRATLAPVRGYMTNHSKNG